MNLNDVLSFAQQSIDGNILTFFAQGIFVYIALLWIVILLWVARDISNRSSSLFFQIFALLLILIFTPFLGLFLYLLFRPSKTLTERQTYNLCLDLLAKEDRTKVLEKRILTEEIARKTPLHSMKKIEKRNKTEQKDV